MSLCLELLYHVKDTGCCAEAGLPCHGQQTANLWSSELQSCHMERASLREGHKAALWLVTAVADTGPSPANNLKMLPLPVPAAAPDSTQPSLPGEDQAGAGALQGHKGERWGCTISCPLAHEAAPAQPAISEEMLWVSGQEENSHPHGWHFTAARMPSLPGTQQHFSRIGSCQKESA